MIERGGETVKVIVRCRPMNGRERNLKCNDVISMDGEKCLCSLKNPNEICAPPKTFTFDSVYGANSTTEQIYNDMVYPLVEGVLEGYNATIFAYGQTGCGKSFTMQGPSAPPAAVGIIPRSFDHVFEATSIVEDTKFLVVASYIEIYNEDVRDLLGTDTKRKLELKESPSNGVYVQDLTRHTVQSVQECQHLMEVGWSNRATGSTLMNADSSRSHSIFTIDVEMMGEEGGIRRGKLNLVDLAGSERQSKTGAAGERLREATKINLSLMALGNVISALVDGKAKHIPYRDSKLTRLLQDSLGGNTKTLMIACLSPADNNYDETLSTLRYANRAKNITNKPKINEDPKDAMLRQYQQEIENLRTLLANGIPGSAVPITGEIENIGINKRDTGESEKLRNDYENEMLRLREEYEREQMTKKKLQEDMENLRQKYEMRMTEQNNKENLHRDELNASNGFLNASQQQVLERLHRLQEKIIGGERAGDKELQERRVKKRKAAEKRLELLAKALATVSDDDGAVLRVYDDIQEELRAKNETLRKYKQKIRGMEKEIVDIQSEFERDRTDFLDTIRKNQRQLLLHQQIIDKMATGLKKESNYCNYEKIKEEAEWSEDLERWKIPDLVIARTKLPPAGQANQINWTPLIEKLQKQKQNDIGFGNWNNLSERISSGSSDSSISSRHQRLERSQVEDVAGNYFKPRRANQLLNQAKEDASRALSTWKDFVHKNKSTRNQNYGSMNSLNLMGVTQSGGPERRPETLSGGSLNNSWSGSTQKPSRLQALPKPKTNKLDLI